MKIVIIITATLFALSVKAQDSTNFSHLITAGGIATANNNAAGYYLGYELDFNKPVNLVAKVGYTSS